MARELDNRASDPAMGSPSFDAYYYARSCGRPYRRDAEWLTFFGRIADRIVTDIRPRRVLDAGCALGLLVETLRSRDVEAFGIDVSAFAIEHVYDPIKPFCRLGSVTDELDGRYDLIIAIEVLEHMAAPDAEIAIENLCTHADDILFSSSPFDYREPTHLNVRPPEYWAEQFARRGFYRDVEFDASFITSWAVRFRKRDDPIHRLVSEYERGLSRVLVERNELRTQTVETQAALSRLSRVVDEGELEALRRDREALALMETSWFWRARQVWVSLRNFGTSTRNLFRRNQPPLRLTSSSSSILNRYVTSAPTPQNALDIFRGEWSSALPEPFSDLKAGAVELFQDPRIQWFATAVGGVSGKSVLELGPLEGGHTYMLEKLGASRIVAVESNVRAFLRCLVVKELLGLQRARFLCGDFMDYLRAEGERFQLCLACGVLYHMQNPAELIALLSRRCSEHLFIWTHFYDEAIISANPRLAPKFTASVPGEHGGFRYTMHRQEYQAALDWAGFCGAGTETSYWMTRDDILGCLQHFGFVVEDIRFEQPDHLNGPAFALVARRVS